MPRGAVPRGAGSQEARGPDLAAPLHSPGSPEPHPLGNLGLGYSGARGTLTPPTLASSWAAREHSASESEPGHLQTILMLHHPPHLRATKSPSFGSTSGTLFFASAAPD